MIRKIFPVFVALALFVTACGQQAEPTMSPEEVQGTAVAAAWTMVAMTQAAIPTATPIPPTETPSPTPLPTFTPVVLPSPTTDFALLPTATQAASSGGGGLCSGILNMAEAGPQSNVRLENKSGGTASVSLFMYAPNAFGQCGSMASNPYVLTKGATLVVSLPKGNYYAYAWITFSGGKVGSAEGYFVNKVADDHLFPVVVQETFIISK